MYSFNYAVDEPMELETKIKEQSLVTSNKSSQLPSWNKGSRNTPYPIPGTSTLMYVRIFINLSCLDSISQTCSFITHYINVCL